MELASVKDALIVCGTIQSTTDFNIGLDNQQGWMTARKCNKVSGKRFQGPQMQMCATIDIQFLARMKIQGEKASTKMKGTALR